MPDAPKPQLTAPVFFVEDGHKWFALRFEVDGHGDYSCIGRLYQCLDLDTGEIGDDQCGVLYLKWDGCAHLGLGDGDMGDYWFHFDGRRQLDRIHRAVQWMWDRCRSRIARYDDEIAQESAPCPKF
jgi:hypothetical protein